MDAYSLGFFLLLLLLRHFNNHSFSWWLNGHNLWLIIIVIIKFFILSNQNEHDPMIVLQNINKGFESCTMIYIFFNHSLLPTKIKLWFATVRYMYTISLRIYKKSDFLFKIRLRNVSMVYEKKVWNCKWNCEKFHRKLCISDENCRLTTFFKCKTSYAWFYQNLQTYSI